MNSNASGFGPLLTAAPGQLGTAPRTTLAQYQRAAANSRSHLHVGHSNSQAGGGLQPQTLNPSGPHVTHIRPASALNTMLLEGPIRGSHTAASLAAAPAGLALVWTPVTVSAMAKRSSDPGECPSGQRSPVVDSPRSPYPDMLRMPQHASAPGALPLSPVASQRPISRGSSGNASPMQAGRLAGPGHHGLASNVGRVSARGTSPLSAATGPRGLTPPPPLVLPQGGAGVAPVGLPTERGSAGSSSSHALVAQMAGAGQLAGESLAGSVGEPDKVAVGTSGRMAVLARSGAGLGGDVAPGGAVRPRRSWLWGCWCGRASSSSADPFEGYQGQDDLSAVGKQRQEALLRRKGSSKRLSHAVSDTGMVRSGRLGLATACSAATTQSGMVRSLVVSPAGAAAAAMNGAATPGSTKSTSRKLQPALSLQPQKSILKAASLRRATSEKEPVLVTVVNSRFGGCGGEVFSSAASNAIGADTDGSARGDLSDRLRPSLAGWARAVRPDAAAASALTNGGGTDPAGSSRGQHRWDAADGTGSLATTGPVGGSDWGVADYVEGSDGLGHSSRGALAAGRAVQPGAVGGDPDTADTFVRQNHGAAALAAAGTAAPLPAAAASPTSRHLLVRISARAGGGGGTGGKGSPGWVQAETPGPGPGSGGATPAVTGVGPQQRQLGQSQLLGADAGSTGTGASVGSNASGRVVRISAPGNETSRMSLVQRMTRQLSRGGGSGVSSPGLHPPANGSNIVRAFRNAILPLPSQGGGSGRLEGSAETLPAAPLPMPLLRTLKSWHRAPAAPSSSASDVQPASLPRGDAVTELSRDMVADSVTAAGDGGARRELSPLLVSLSLPLRGGESSGLVHYRDVDEAADGPWERRTAPLGLLQGVVTALQHGAGGGGSGDGGGSVGGAHGRLHASRSYRMTTGGAVRPGTVDSGAPVGAAAAASAPLGRMLSGAKDREYAPSPADLYRQLQEDEDARLGSQLHCPESPHRVGTRAGAEGAARGEAAAGVGTRQKQGSGLDGSVTDPPAARPGPHPLLTSLDLEAAAAAGGGPGEPEQMTYSPDLQPVPEMSERGSATSLSPAALVGCMDALTQPGGPPGAVTGHPTGGARGSDPPPHRRDEVTPDDGDTPTTLDTSWPAPGVPVRIPRADARGSRSGTRCRSIEAVSTSNSGPDERYARIKTPSSVEDFLTSMAVSLGPSRAPGSGGRSLGGQELASDPAGHVQAAAGVVRPGSQRSLGDISNGSGDSDGWHLLDLRQARRMVATELLRMRNMGLEPGVMVENVEAETGGAAPGGRQLPRVPQHHQQDQLASGFGGKAQGRGRDGQGLATPPRAVRTLTRPAAAPSLLGRPAVQGQQEQQQHLPHHRRSEPVLRSIRLSGSGSAGDTSGVVSSNGTNSTNPDSGLDRRPGGVPPHADHHPHHHHPRQHRHRLSVTVRGDAHGTGPEAAVPQGAPDAGAVVRSRVATAVSVPGGPDVALPPSRARLTKFYSLGGEVQPRNDVPPPPVAAAAMPQALLRPAPLTGLPLTAAMLRASAEVQQQQKHLCGNGAFGSAYTVAAAAATAAAVAAGPALSQSSGLTPQDTLESWVRDHSRQCAADQSLPMTPLDPLDELSIMPGFGAGPKPRAVAAAPPPARSGGSGGDAAERSANDPAPSAMPFWRTGSHRGLRLTPEPDVLQQWLYGGGAPGEGAAVAAATAVAGEPAALAQAAVPAAAGLVRGALRAGGAPVLAMRQSVPGYIRLAGL